MYSMFLLLVSMQFSYAQFTQGNLVVLQVGDGSTILNSSSSYVFLKEFTTSGVNGISVTIPTAGSARLTTSGSATSEGLITLSTDSQHIIIPGYDAAAGTTSIASTPNPTTSRVLDTVNYNGLVGRAVSSSTAFSGNNCRGGISDGTTNFWATGATTGICYFGSGSPVTVSSTVPNTRALNIFNNILYFSTSSGTHGIYSVGTGGPPTNTGNASNLLINTAGSPYQFSFNNSATICYIADDQASASGGIQKWTLNAGVWTLAYTLGTGAANIGARGLCVDWSGASPIVYATTGELSNNRIIKITDIGASSTATTLSTASGNTIYRGLAFAPYCNLPKTNSITSNGPVCSGQPLNLNINSSSTYPITYSWAGGGTFSSTSVSNPSVSSPLSGTYSVNTSNKCGVTTSTISVVVNPLPNVHANTTATAVCVGSPITLTGSGAASYLWTNSVSDGVAFTPANTNTYTVLGIDINNCANTATISVIVNSLPNVQANTTSTAVCAGSQITLSGGGATTYTWTNSVSNGTIFTPSATTTYTVTGIDNNNCVNTATVNVAVNSLPNVQANTTSSTICAGGQVTLSGSGATTYSWSNSVTNGVVFTPSVTNTYTVTGIDNNSCVNTATINVTVNNLPNVQANTTSNAICAGGQVTLYGSGATIYNWSNSVSDGVIFTPSTTNTYTVIGTDNNNCVNTATVGVIVNNLPTISLSSYSTCTGQPITLYAMPNSLTSYTWTGTASSSNTATVAPVTNSSYTVQGTDVNGCVSNIAIDTVSITPSIQITVASSNNLPCIGSTYTLSGNGATTYTWMPSIGSYNSLDANNTQISITQAAYAITFTVSGTSICPSTSTVITINSSPIVTPTITSSPANITVCSGDSITLTASGASTYTWAPTIINGVPFAPQNNSTYTVNGTDANGCSTANQTISINVNQNPTITISPLTNTICIGNTCTLTASGANSYTWNTGATGNIITDNPTTTSSYTITGTDINGCKNTQTANVIVNQLPIVVASTNSTSICIGQNITLTGSGAVTYTWNNSISNGVSFTPVTTNIYTVTGTDNNGCKNQDTIQITVNQLPIVGANASANPVCTNDMITLYGSGANTYTWMGSVTNNSPFNASSSSTYTVTGVDTNNCSATSVLSVTVNPLPTVLALSTSTLVCRGDSITLSCAGAQTYTWNNGITNGVAFTPTISNTYVVNGADSNGCKNSALISITVNQLPIISVNASSISICTGGSVTLLASGAQTYTWSNGIVNGASFNPTSTSTYTVTGTDNNNCINTTTINVVVNTIPIPVVSTATPAICSGQQNQLSASGGTNYNWLPLNGLSSSTIPNPIANPTSTTVYTVTVSNGNCTAISNVQVVVHPTPQASVCCNASIFTGQSVTLITNQTNNSYLYNWLPIDNLSCINCSNPIATPENTTTYTVTVSDTNGCSTISSVLIEVKEDCGKIFIPNAFSPNGDNENDKLFVFGKCIENLNFSVYDRWGNKVFESNTVTNGWDGTYGGKAMDPGTFAYYLSANINGETVTKKGNISLIR